MSDDETRDGRDWIGEAEAARRAGRAVEARRLTEAALVDDPRALAGRVVLALACLDLGDAEGARRALEPAVGASPAPEPLALDDTEPDEPFQVLSDPLADLAENELERAFDHAESEVVEAWTTNRVAEAALHAVDRNEDGAPAEPEVEPTLHEAPFATETLATLYERQGAAERAQAIRRSLRGETAVRPPPSPDERVRWVSTLERWLDNLRRASR